MRADEPTSGRAHPRRPHGAAQAAATGSGRSRTAARGAGLRCQPPLLVRTILDLPYGHSGAAWGRGFGRVRVTLMSRGSALHGLSIYRSHDGVEVEAVRVVYGDDLARIRRLVFAIIEAAPVGEDGVPWLECLRLRAGPTCDFFRVEVPA